MEGGREIEKGESLSIGFDGIGEDNTVDWRGRPSKLKNHGGMRAAVFVLGLQTFEIMGIAAVGNNLITYVINEMHFPLSKAANIVTNFVGTIFILALLGGFLADSYFGSFWTILFFAFVELSGFILLSVQAHVGQLKPPPCNMVTNGGECVEAKGMEAVIFFGALYLVALGSGCVKPNMIAHGADQFGFNSNSNPNSNKKLSTYFNAAYFAFSVGELVALTLLVWLQTHSGMDVGFGMSAAAMGMGLICFVCGTLLYRNKRPQGSIFTPFAQIVSAILFPMGAVGLLDIINLLAGFKNSGSAVICIIIVLQYLIKHVFVAAFMKRKLACPSDALQLHGSQKNGLSSNIAVDSTETAHLLRTDKFRFLDKACIKIRDGDSAKESPWRLCTVTQVEQLKILLSVLPIFACTIVFNTVLAQLQTFSVQQGSAMNTQLTKSFRIPPASLQSIPYIILIFAVPLYDVMFVPFAQKITGNPSGISPLQRIGFGLFFVTFSMVSAALMEKKRRDAAIHSDKILSIFWITPQFLIFGVSEMFTAVGLIEFFYKQSLKGMQAFLTAITYCSYSFGFYLSSVLVSLANKITSSSSNGGWLSENDLNKDRLDLFYWFLAVLSFVNFLNYLFWSKWYSSNPVVVTSVNPQRSVEEFDQHGFSSAKSNTGDIKPIAT